MKKILVMLLASPVLAWASGGNVALDRAPVDLHDKASLQRGAQIFVNHCLNCHGATAMRYGKLTDLGLTEAQIKDNLLFTAEKVGDNMASAMDSKTAKAAFGVVPPDLSLVSRSRGSDWLYTYMRSFYKDPATKSGWNNAVFPNVAMPHVLWEYQGPVAMQVSVKEEHGEKHETRKLVPERPGTLSSVEYDRYVGDLVNFLTYVGEPAQADRKIYGIFVLFFLSVLFVVSLLLKKEFWKDVR